jgi:hypothetical protein
MKASRTGNNELVRSEVQQALAVNVEPAAAAWRPPEDHPFATPAAELQLPQPTLTEACRWLRLKWPQDWKS